MHDRKSCGCEQRFLSSLTEKKEQGTTVLQGRALFDLKSKNNEQCIKSHYIVLNVHSGKPGLLVKCNLIVTVNGKYTFVQDILWHL